MGPLVQDMTGAIEVTEAGADGVQEEEERGVRVAPALGSQSILVGRNAKHGAMPKVDSQAPHGDGNNSPYDTESVRYLTLVIYRSILCIRFVFSRLVRFPHCEACVCMSQNCFVSYLILLH